MTKVSPHYLSKKAMKTIDLPDLNAEIAFNIDYFFCSVSFEERCWSIAQNIRSEKIKNSVICCNIDQEHTFRGHRDILSKVLENTTITNLDLKSDSPIETADTFIKFFSEVKNVQTAIFAIDITTFTHEALLILLRVIQSKQIPEQHVYYLYNNASDYSIKELDPHDKWLSIGIKEIRSVIGFSGFMSPLKKNMLIVLVGFEPERTTKLIECYEPHRIVFGVGGDHCSDASSAIELNRVRHRELVEEYPNASSFEFSLLSPEATYEALLSISKEFSDYNVIIAPMNNKISTLGAALYALDHKHVQLCYVPAMYYNTEGYSLPGTKCFFFQLVTSPTEIALV